MTRLRDPIDARLKALQKKAKNWRADEELRLLDDMIPLSPLPRLAGRPLPSFAEKSLSGAASAAANAAATRAAAAHVCARRTGAIANLIDVAVRAGARAAMTANSCSVLHNEVC